MGGSTKKIDTMPSDTVDTRRAVGGFLTGTPQQQGAGPSVPGYDNRSRPYSGRSGDIGAGMMPPSINEVGMLPGGQQPNGPFGIGSGMERMFAGIPGGGSPQVEYGGDASMFDPAGIRSVGAGIDRSGVGNVGVGSPVMDMIRRNYEATLNQGANPAIIAGTPGTDSVDSLGGAGSAFFDNMVARYQPAFAQRRAEGMAAATERSGNLTGSGFANALGSSINRSLGEEQAKLADIGQWGVGKEVDRQVSMAGLGNQRNIAQGQLDSAQISEMMRAGTGMSDVLARLGISDQNADMNVMDMILRGQGMNQGADVSFMNAELARRTGNANRMQDRNNLTGQLGVQTRGQNMDLANANAQRFQQMLGQFSTAGVGPSQIQQSGGFGNFLGGVVGTVGGAALGPIGAAVGNKIGSKIF